MISKNADTRLKAYWSRERTGTATRCGGRYTDCLLYTSSEEEDWNLDEDSGDDVYFDEEDDGSTVQTGETSLIYLWYLSVIALCALSVFIVLFRCTAMYEMIRRKLRKQ